MNVDITNIVCPATIHWCRSCGHVPRNDEPLVPQLFNGCFVCGGRLVWLTAKATWNVLWGPKDLRTDRILRYHNGLRAAWAVWRRAL